MRFLIILWKRAKNALEEYEINLFVIVITPIMNFHA